MSYLHSLTARLAACMECLPADLRARHSRFFQAAQRADGGFAGREGESNLYYTSFALRGLAILGELHGAVAQRAGEFLRARLTSDEPLIDRMSLVFGAAQLDAAAGIDVLADAGPRWKASLAAELQALRCADGGFAKGPEGTAGSTYHTFLALLCLQLIDHPLTDPENVVRFTRAQRSADGGFLEIRVGKRAGTNPTAAAIGVLRMLDALEPADVASTAAFLGQMQNTEGGLLANSRIPVADLLSTFTGCLTLADLDHIDVLQVAAALSYARSLAHPDGGFLAGVWDEERDVEYSFYGVGTLALLNSIVA
ncbi:MAG: beta-hydroxylase [Planctomycetaceae bacterium]|nr:beta-hydroxylase [Planctomycetaceae bacterium]